MTKNIDYKRITKFALFGAVGFGIGGLILGLAFEAAGRVNWKTADMWESIPILLFPLFMIIAGAIGGIALGLALRRRISCFLTFLMAMGFFPGMLAITWILYRLGFSIDDYNHIPFTTLFGLMLGILLGFYLGSWRKFLLLAVAGALGGVLAGAITYPVYSDAWYIITFQGVIGGAFLGGALGILETSIPVEIYTSKGRKYSFFDQIEKKTNWYCAECDSEISESDRACPKCGIEFG